MAKNIDLTDPSIVGTILSDIEGSEERDRKQHNFDSWQIYSGNQIQYTENELKRTRPKAWSTYTISDISIAKMVVDKLAESYREQPIREIQGDSQDTKNERLSDIYREADAKNQMPFGDKIANLHKHMLMWVNYRMDEDGEGRYQFMALQGFEYSVVRDKDTGELLAVILNYGNLDITSNSFSGDGVDNLIAESQADSSAGSKVYAMWSNDNFVVVKSEVSIVPTMKGEEIKRSVTYVDIPDNPEMVNPIGMVPFVFVPFEPSIDFPTPNPLATQSVTYNVLNSELLTASNIQGTGQMVISYPEKYEGKFKNVTTGLTSAIKLPQSDNPEDRDTTVQYINPNPDLAGQKETAMSYMRQVLAQHGITNTQGVSGDGQSFSSALERMIANVDIQHIIEKNQQLYVDMEHRMFEIIKAWESWLGINTFSEEDEMQIIFKKPKLVISDAEVLANIEKMLQLGLIEEHEKFMIIDPNMSEEEAKEKLEKVQEAKMARMPARLRIVDNGGQGNEDSEPREGTEESTEGIEG